MWISSKLVDQPDRSIELLLMALNGMAQGLQVSDTTIIFTYLVVDRSILLEEKETSSSTISLRSRESTSEYSEDLLIGTVLVEDKLGRIIHEELDR